MTDSTVSRRAVIAGAGTAALAAGLAACSSGSDATAGTTPAADPVVTDAASPTNSAAAMSNAAIIARVADVPVGTAFQFTNPTDGNPGYVMQPSAGAFIAYSAVCTHEGCIVNPEGAGFQCPCHGAEYDSLGNPTAGPAKKALAPIAILVEGDNIVLA